MSSRLGAMRCSKNLTVPSRSSNTHTWNQWSSLSWRSETGSRGLHSKVYGTELRSARYSRFGAAARQVSRASRSNALSARVSDRMADESWVWRGKAALNVNRASDSDSGKKHSAGRTSSQVSSLKPYSLIRTEKCSRAGREKSRAARRA